MKSLLQKIYKDRIQISTPVPGCNLLNGFLPECIFLSFLHSNLIFLQNISPLLYINSLCMFFSTSKLNWVLVSIKYSNLLLLLTETNLKDWRSKRYLNKVELQFLPILIVLYHLLFSKTPMFFLSNIQKIFSLL